MKNSTQPISSDVDTYLAALPAPVAELLSHLRKTIRKAAPQAEEVISYQIPTYKLHGPLVHFAAFRNHCSFFGVSRSTLLQFKDELKGFKISGTTIHFSPENPLPTRVVTAIVKIRIAENKETQLSKGKRKTKSNGTATRNTQPSSAGAQRKKAVPNQGTRKTAAKRSK